MLNGWYFQNLFNTGYWIPKQDVELAEDIPYGRTTKWMIEQAKKYQILVTGCIIATTKKQRYCYRYRFDSK